eukprot:gene9250-biopygen9125
MLRTLHLAGAGQVEISNVSYVCSQWNSIIKESLTEVLILSRKVCMAYILRLALVNHKEALVGKLILREECQSKAEEVMIRTLSSIGGGADDSDVLYIITRLLHLPINSAHADCQDGRALVLAASKGHTDIVRMLLEAHDHAAHADCQDGRALVSAAKSGHSEIVRLLLEASKHADHADSLEGEALVWAAKSGYTDIVRMLLEAPQHAAHADCQDCRAAMYAATNGCTDILRLFDRGT